MWSGCCWNRCYAKANGTKHAPRKNWEFRQKPCSLKCGWPAYKSKSFRINSFTEHAWRYAAPQFRRSRQNNQRFHNQQQSTTPQIRKGEKNVQQTWVNRCRRLDLRKLPLQFSAKLFGNTIYIDRPMRRAEVR